MTKTYAIKQKDYVGATYTVGYALADTRAEATEKARHIHPNAWAEALDQDAERDAIDQIISAHNAETSRRLREARS